MMGNWRTVNITGTFDEADLAAARLHVTVLPDYSNFGPLSATRGLCGLGRWPDREVDVAGNLAERNYSVDDVAKALRNLQSMAPSARLKVHCGGEYEDTTCVATITVEGGKVTVGDPEVPSVAPVSEDLTVGRLVKAVTKDPRPHSLIDPPS